MSRIKAAMFDAGGDDSESDDGDDDETNPLDGVNDLLSSPIASEGGGGRPSKRVTSSADGRSAPKARASYKQSDADREFISIIAAAMKVDLAGMTTWEEAIGRVLKRCQNELILLTSTKSPFSIMKGCIDTKFLNISRVHSDINLRDGTGMSTRLRDRLLIRSVDEDPRLLLLAICLFLRLQFFICLLFIYFSPFSISLVLISPTIFQL